MRGDEVDSVSTESPVTGKDISKSAALQELTKGT